MNSPTVKCPLPMFQSIFTKSCNPVCSQDLRCTQEATKEWRQIHLHSLKRCKEHGAEFLRRPVVWRRRLSQLRCLRRTDRSQNQIFLMILSLYYHRWCEFCSSAVELRLSVIRQSKLMLIFQLAATHASLRKKLTLCHWTVGFCVPSASCTSQCISTVSPTFLWYRLSGSTTNTGGFRTKTSMGPEDPCVPWAL